MVDIQKYIALEQALEPVLVNAFHAIHDLIRSHAIDEGADDLALANWDADYASRIARRQAIAAASAADPTPMGGSESGG